MASPTGPPLTSARYGDTLLTSAAGQRDVLIVASLVHTPSPDIVPRSDFEPTEQDQRRLANQGVHVESYDDLRVIKARIARDGECSLVGEEISLPGRELTRDHVLKRLKLVLNNCSKDGGKLIHNYWRGTQTMAVEPNETRMIVLVCVLVITLRL